MSGNGVKKKYSSVMEEIIKNAVSETSKVLENMVEELKAEVLRVKSENENLRIRCSQFEDVLKKRSVYRETGTSPEPYIIEKCDKSVQCDFVSLQASKVELDTVMFRLPTQEVHTDDEEQNLSLDENDIQDNDSSDIPFGPINETDCSNDFFSFLKLKENELNVSSQVNLSSGDNKTEESLVGHATGEGMSADNGCMEQQLKNTEDTECSETQAHLPELENVTTILFAQNNMDVECETYNEISKIETQETLQGEELDFSQGGDLKFAKTDQLLLDCQEGQNEKEEVEPTDQIRIPLQERHVSQIDDDVNFGVSNIEQTDVVASSSLDLMTKNPRLPTFPPEAEEEITEEESQDYKQTQNDGDSAADVTINIPDSFVHADIFNVSDHSATQFNDTDDIEASVIESQPLFTEINNSTDEVMSIEESLFNKRQTTSQLTSTPLQSIQSRQRCTSVTLEDAMLLLDAINQHKYKGSSLHVSNIDTSETASHPVVTETTHIQNESINSEENVQTTKTSAQLDNSSETTQVTEAKVCPANIDTDQNHHKTSFTTPTKSSTVEPATDNISLLLTPEKQATPNCDSEGQKDNELKEDDLIPSASPMSSPKSLPKTESAKTINVTQFSGQQSDLDGAIASPLEKNEPTTQTMPHIILTNHDKTIVVTKITSHSTPSDNDYQQNDITVSSTPLQTSTHNLLAANTVLLNAPTDPVEQITAVPQKTNTSPQSLSPAQLSAVLSAVRSSQNSNLPKLIAPNATKKTLIAVPFSLQSVMKPHHKIIVIPRQCRAPPSQAVATNNQAIVQPKKLFTTDQTATNNTATVNPETTFSDATVPQDSSPDNMDSNQQPPLKTQPTWSHPETSALQLLVPAEIQSASLPATLTPKCKNKVQIRLRRLPFAISTAHSVSVSNISNGSSKIIIRKTAPKNLPVKAPPISLIETSKSEAQPVTNTQAILTKPIGKTGPSPVLPSIVDTPIENLCTVENDRSTHVNQSSAVMQLSPIVSGDHSYPQLSMTKSQFLAQLNVSPVVEASNKVNAIGKEAQKMSLVDRLRNHLAKPHLPLVRAEQKTKEGLNQNCSSSDVHVQKTTSTSFNDIISGLDCEQLSDVAKEMSCFPDSCFPDAHVEKDNIVSTKRSPDTINVSDDGHIKRKANADGLKSDNITTATTTVKKPRLKRSNENENCSPIPVKILCNNALISCTKRRRSYRHAKQKTFLCKFCHKEFLKKGDIETHVQMHAGKKPFQCTICAKRFSKTLELSRHLKRHERERKFPCPTCGKAFVDHNNLKRHLYIHMENKPYSCPHCPKTFSQACHRKSHMKNKHKND